MIEMQLYMKKKEEHKAISSDCNVLRVKLPKLVISRFDGTHIDWSRFWNQFESEIDRSELHAVSKFSLFIQMCLLKLLKRMPTYLQTLFILQSMPLSIMVIFHHF